MRLGGLLPRRGGGLRDLPRAPPRNGERLGDIPRRPLNPPLLGGDQPRPPCRSPNTGRGPNPPLSLLGGLNRREGGFCGNTSLTTTSCPSI